MYSTIVLYIEHACTVHCTYYSSFFAKVPDEKFLVLVNDLLASGEIPGLFVDDEVDGIISRLSNECKVSGIQDTRENVWRFFIDRVRRQLKVRNTCRINDSKTIIIVLDMFVKGCIVFLSCWIYSESTREKVPSSSQLHLY